MERRALEAQLDIEIRNLQNLLELPTIQNYHNRGLGSYAIGNIYTPRLFAANLDIKAVIHDDIVRLTGNSLVDPETEQGEYEAYISKFWALALFDLARYMSEQEPDYEKMVDNLANDVVIPSVAEMSGITQIRSQQMKTLQGVIKKAFGKSKYANNRFQAPGLAALASVILSGINFLNLQHDLEKQKELAKKIYHSSILLEHVIGFAKQSRYYSEDPIFRDVIVNFEQIERIVDNQKYLDYLSEISQHAISLGGTLLVTPVLVKFGLLGGIKGIFISIVVGTVIDLGLGMFNEGHKYLYSINVASMEYSLALEGRDRPDYSYVAASLVHAGNKNMLENVVGKIGKYMLLQNPLYTVELLTDIEETKKWNNYLDDYFKRDFFSFIFGHSDGNLVPLIKDYVACWRKSYGTYIIFLVDLSASMNDFNKLVNVKKAIPDIIKDIRLGNNFYSLVSFNTDELDNKRCCSPEKIRTPILLDFTDEADKVMLHTSGLEARGYTPLLSGLQKAFEHANRIPLSASGLIILLADGQHNCPECNGLRTLPPLSEIILEKFDIRENQNVRLSTVAFGQSEGVLNNLKSYLSLRNPFFANMRKLAQEGGGFYARSDNPSLIKAKLRHAILERNLTAEKFVPLVIFAISFILFSAILSFFKF